MQIIYKKIEDLVPYDKNPRLNKEAVKYVANSIKEFGFKNPIILDKDNVIVCGHTRYLASQRLKLKEVPCIMADDLTEEQIKAFRLADNKSAEFAEWDMDLLAGELGDIDTLDMSAFGFEELDTDDQEVVEDDYEEPEELEPRAKLGDVYQLGRHRLMCGDSTSSADVYKLMNGELADLVVTDPPYNVDYVGKTKDALKIQNDSMESSKFFDFLCNAFENMCQSLRLGGAFYVWYASREVVNFSNALEEAGLTVKQELIWNKNSMVMGRQDYQWKHEPCLYGWKEGASHYFTDDRTQTTVIEDAKPDFKKMKKDELVSLLQEIFSDKVSTTVINEDRPSQSSLHPTMKPVKLLARLVRNSSRRDELILDLFGGSGSTLMCAEQLHRRCNMMEYDPHYVDVIIDRWEQFTGQVAVKIC